LAIFLYLARWTDIIRDTTAPLRPDKRWPYGLSRAQMAFWFFLVIGAFFFLWVIIGDTDTLNSSVLGLIGISASTALAAAFVDSGKRLPQQVNLTCRRSIFHNRDRRFASRFAISSTRRRRS
jgi:hypothetical protein